MASLTGSSLPSRTWETLDSKLRMRFASSEVKGGLQVASNEGEMNEKGCAVTCCPTREYGKSNSNPRTEGGEFQKFRSGEGLEVR